MRGLRPLLGKELREQALTMRALLILGPYLFMGITSPLTTYALPALLSFARERGNLYLELGLSSEPTLRDALSTYHNNFGIMAIVVILVAMGAVAGERSRGTLTLLLTKPVSPGAILGAKIMALTTTLALGQLLATAAFMASAALFFRLPPLAPFLELNLYLFLAMLLYGAITLLGSVLFRRQGGAAGLGLLAMVSMTAFDQLPFLRRYTPAGMNDAIKSLVASGVSGDRGLAAWITLGVIALTLAEAFRRFRPGKGPS